MQPIKTSVLSVLEVFQAHAQWEPFDDVDYDMYAGCDSRNANFTFAEDMSSVYYVIICYPGTRQAAFIQAHFAECDGFYDWKPGSLNWEPCNGAKPLELEPLPEELVG